MSAQIIDFVKMEGSGNDFVLVDSREALPCARVKFVQLVADRHFGIGCDGVIFLDPSTLADFRMTYFNADGGETICGNGLRCLARYIVSRGFIEEGRKEFEIETLTGVVPVRVFGRGERIRVDLGHPIFEGARIPTASSGEQLGVRLEVDGKSYPVHAVSIGNPHCVLFVPDVSNAPVSDLGRKLEQHSFFPQRANVEFVEVIDDERFRVRVWERGIGETLSCGTGVCAALVTAVRAGYSKRKVMAETGGGVLEVNWDETTDRVYLTGSQEEVYHGQVDVNRLIDGAARRANRGALPAS